LAAIGFFILFIIIIFVMVRSTIENAKKQNKNYSAFTKILMNHLQTLALISALELNWGKRVIEYFDGVQIIAQASSSLVSFECLLDDSNLCFKILEGNIGMAYELVRSIVIIISVIPLLAGGYLFWLIFLTFKGHDKEKIKSRVVMTFTVLLFLIYPSLNDIIFNALK
jgi:ABC-type nitrate/sulfonate/bicarbonate transport system permease component